MGFSPGDIVYHFPPDEALVQSGPHLVFRLLHTDPEGNSHYLILPDLILDEVELISAADYRRSRIGKVN